jgi:hypothetical protein
MWWMAAGVVVLALALFVAVLVSLAGHLRPLARAVHRLRLRAEQAQRLQTALLAVQGQLVDLQRSAEEAEVSRRRRRGLSG